MQSKPPTSNCHQAPLKAVQSDDGTSYFICTECNQPADIYSGDNREPAVQSKREIQEEPGYKYLVEFVIDVKRTDKQMLTDAENQMVQEMRTATEAAIAEVMKNHGQNNSKNLGNRTVIY